jgi:hypothetical protein
MVWSVRSVCHAVPARIASTPSSGYRREVGAAGPVAITMRAEHTSRGAARAETRSGRSTARRIAILAASGRGSPVSGDTAYRSESHGADARHVGGTFVGARLARGRVERELLSLPAQSQMNKECCS